MPRKPPPNARRKGNKPRTERGQGSARREREPSGSRPEIGVVEISAIDIDSGEMEARPLNWAAAGPPPLVHIVAERASLAVGERAVVRYEQKDDGIWQARLIRALGGEPQEGVAED